MERSVVFRDQEPEQLRGIHAPLKTHQFLVEAQAEGAHLIEPENPRVRKNWARTRNMAGIYYGTHLTLEDIGIMYRYRADNKREGPRRVIRRFLRTLHSNCSQQLQEKYPLDELVIGKTWSEE